MGPSPPSGFLPLCAAEASLETRREQRCSPPARCLTQACHAAASTAGEHRPTEWARGAASAPEGVSNVRCLSQSCHVAALRAASSPESHSDQPLALPTSAAASPGSGSASSLRAEFSSPPERVAKVAFITAIFGTYETILRPFEPQSVPTDFICFTDNASRPHNGWSVDTFPYHLRFNPPNQTYRNSVGRNSHPFNVAKFYKQSFHRVPRLRRYRVVVWIDGSIEIAHPATAAYVYELVVSRGVLVATWEHNLRHGRLMLEAIESSRSMKYASTSWLGQSQPFQDVSKLPDAVWQPNPRVHRDSLAS